VRALGVGLVEALGADPEAARVAADVAQGQQPGVAVKGSVLHALGHHRRGRLLKARDELGRSRTAQQQHLGDLNGHIGGGHRLTVRIGDDARLRLHVGPVDRERGDRPRERAGVWSRAVRRPGQPLHLGGEHSGRLLALGLRRHVGKGSPVARELLPQRGEGWFGRRVDEQRAHVVEELVADGAGDRPVAQDLGGLEDLLDPDRRGSAVAQSPKVLRRVGQPVGMVDAQRVDQAVAHQAQGQRMRGLKDLGVLLADAGEVVDVEEAPVVAGGRVDVEELLAQLRVGPEAIGVVGGHVVGYEVEHDPQPGRVGSCRQLAKRGLAPQILGDPGGVDDVIAVGRTRPCLE
jgi:hypothetical protein